MSNQAENSQKPDKKGSNKKSKKDNKKSSINLSLKSLRTSLTGISIRDKHEEDNNSKISSETADIRKSADISNQVKQNSDNVGNKIENIHRNSKEDPAFNFINNLKEHERFASLRKKKDTIFKILASIISIALILTGVVYSFGPTTQVASNVIFGERAMFSVFLIMVGFLILAAVFANRLLEGRFLRNIRQDLEIVEGKKQNNDKKYDADQKKSMNKSKE